jgi:ABC-type transporter Mla subunit MlaD
MRRALLIAVALIGAVALLVGGTGAGGEDGTYEVRGIFDNAAFLVKGEQVRVAGATVGTISDVDVTTPNEPARADGSPDPGKAVVVMRIDDPGFQDFRTDASCLIRPQSLIGEKFVECQPTQPRAAGTEPPPELEQIPDGEPGEGQYLLPLENNGTTVDLDLVNNIMEEPYPDRFRLIINSLGASFAARGEDLAEIVERSNPALKETNRVLEILADQNHTLSQLSKDSDAVLTALARRRENLGNFINQSEVVAAATAERGADLQESFARFPTFLRELRLTMDRLDAFSTTATPVFQDLGTAAAPLTRATEALGPFSEAGIPALTSLGRAAEQAGPDLVASDPVIRQVRKLAKSGKKATVNLGKILTTLRKTRGYEFLNDFIFNAGGSVNAYDGFGHFLRALLPNNNCVDYEVIAEQACAGFFYQQRVPTTAKQIQRLIERQFKQESLGETRDRNRRDGDGDGGTSPDGDDPDRESETSPGGGFIPDLFLPPEEPGTEASPTPDPESTPEPSAPSTASPSPSARAADARATRDLLNFLIGSPSERRAGGEGR